MPIPDTLRARLAVIPIFKFLDLQLESAADGRATLLAPYRKEYEGIFESFHGGLMMTLADTVACIAILTKIGAEESVTTTDMNIRFLAACRTECRAEARVIKIGRTLCPAEVSLYDAQGTLTAIAQVTYMRLTPR